MEFTIEAVDYCQNKSEQAWSHLFVVSIRGLMRLKANLQYLVTNFKNRHLNLIALLLILLLIYYFKVIISP